MLVEHERTSVVEWDCQDANNILTPILATGINFLMCNLISMMGIEDLGSQHLFRSCSSKLFPKGSLLLTPPTPAPSSGRSWWKNDFAVLHYYCMHLSKMRQV